MLTPSRRAAAILTALAMSVCAPALLAAHPHGPGEIHDMPAQNMPAQDIQTQDIQTQDIQTQDIQAQENAPLEITDIIQITPEDLESKTVMQTEAPDTGDFDVNDFLGADGMVDVEKLRAYEDGKQNYIAQNAEAASDEPVRSRAEIDPETDEIIIYERPIQMPPKEETADTVTTYDYGSYVVMPPAAPSTAGDMIDRMVDAPEIPAEQPAIPTMADVPPLPHPRAERADSKTSSSTFFGDLLRDLEKSNRKKTRKQKRTDRSRTITLSGETTVHIAPDGAVTITNNGDAVVPLKFSDNETGNVSAMVMDGGKPAKVTVNKNVTTENGKRKIHLEVEMESDIID